MSQILYNTLNIDAISFFSIEEAIHKTIENDDSTSIIYIVPTGKIVRHLEKKILFKYFEKTGRPLERLNIFTLQTFIRHIFLHSSNHSNSILISDAYRLALFEEAVEKANLQFFKGKNNKVSYNLLKKLSDVIMGLREDGIELEDIKQNLEMDKKKEAILAVDLARLEDIYSLYAAYQDILADRFLDFSAMLKLVSSKIRLGEIILTNIFPKNKQIIIEGFTEFKKPELEFIKVIGNSNLPMIININYDEQEGPLYTILEKSISTLVDTGFHIISVKEKQKDSQLSDYLKKYLFGWNKNKDIRISHFTKILEAPSRIEEVILIARLVKYLILRENYNPSDICIVTRQPNLYATLFREVLFTHKLPANVTDRYELAKSPLIVGVISTLNLIANDFKFDDLVKFLNNPYITLKNINGDNIDSNNIVSVLVKLRISGGKYRGGIKSILKQLENNQKSYQKRLETIENDPLVEPYELLGTIEFLKRIDTAILDLNIINLKLFSNKNQYRPEEFADFINTNIIDGFCIHENILNRLNLNELSKKEISALEKSNFIEEIEKDSKALNSLRTIVNEMIHIISDRHPNERFKFSDLNDKLITAISGSKYQVYEKVGYGVTVTTIEQTRQIPYKVSILCGAVDSEFPTQYRPETFLGMKLPDSELRHILSERMQFFQFLTNGSEFIDSNEKRIYITYPKFTEEKELVRSPFVDALLRISTIEEDNCLIDFSIIKSRLMNESIEDKADKLIDSYPWLHSVASEIDLQSLYAEGIKLKKNSSEQIFNNSPNLLITKPNIDNYIKFKLNQKNDIVRIDKETLPEEIREQLIKISSGAFSISSLEEYALCPYKYFLNHVLNLDIESELELAITPMEMGNLLHKTLYTFYSMESSKLLESNPDIRLDNKSELQQPPIIPVKLDPGMKTKYLDTILNIAEELIAEIQFEHPLFHVDKRTILGDKNQIGLLELWLDNELERIKNRWGSVPVLFEFAYGLKSIANTSLDVIDLDGLKIKGKIDRVEKLIDRDEFIVADYKLSSNNNPSTNQVKEGKIFQLPLYMLAMRKIFNENYDLKWEPVGGFYYYFKTKMDKNTVIDSKVLLITAGGTVSKYFTGTQSPLAKEDILEDVLNGNLNAAKEIVGNISEGVFDVKPQKGACKYCDFKSICRVDFI